LDARQTPVIGCDLLLVIRLAGHLTATPQGGGIAHVPFERYVDDVICHCRSAEEACGVPLADRGLQAGAASGENEGRLLLGCEPKG
jgi:hypothetical protein